MDRVERSPANAGSLPTGGGAWWLDALALTLVPSALSVDMVRQMWWCRRVHLHRYIVKPFKITFQPIVPRFLCAKLCTGAQGKTRGERREKHHPPSSYLQCWQEEQAGCCAFRKAPCADLWPPELSQNDCSFTNVVFPTEPQVLLGWVFFCSCRYGSSWTMLHGELAIFLNAVATIYLSTSTLKTFAKIRANHLPFAKHSHL